MSLSHVVEQKDKEREQRKRENEQRTYESHRAAVHRVMSRFPKGEPETVIKDATALNSKHFTLVFNDLLTAQEIKACRFDRGEHSEAPSVDHRSLD